jgi:hypothetical protein
VEFGCEIGVFVGFGNEAGDGECGPFNNDENEVLQVEKRRM